MDYVIWGGASFAIGYFFGVVWVIPLVLLFLFLRFRN
jgi:hypothetical protein